MGVRKYPVKLKLPKEFLETLPTFAAPTPKTKAKKSAEKATSEATSTVPSPTKAAAPKTSVQKAAAPKAAAPKSQSSPQKETSTSHPQTILHSNLVRGVTPAKKWSRSTREIKTFTGFKMTMKNWVRGSTDVKTEADSAAVGS